MSVSKTAYYYRAKERTGDIEIEACLKKLADEHMNLFSNLFEVRAITREWLKSYNTQRPHESLVGLPPVQFVEMRHKQLTGKGRNSTFN